MSEEWTDIGAIWLNDDGVNMSLKLNGWDKSVSVRKNDYKQPGERTPDYRVRTNNPALIALHGKRESAPRQGPQPPRPDFAGGTSSGMDDVPFSFALFFFGALAGAASLGQAFL